MTFIVWRCKQTDQCQNSGASGLDARNRDAWTAKYASYVVAL